MRLIRLAVILTLSIVLAPLAAEAQPAGKVYRVGFLWPGREPSTPSTFPFSNVFRQSLAVEFRCDARDRITLYIEIGQAAYSSPPPEF